MNALALILSLAVGPGDFEEDRLPRSLSESFVPPLAARAEEGHAVLLGGHLGFADAVDTEKPAFIAGLEWRIHILPWLGAGGTIDYQTREYVKDLERASYFQIPFMWSFLFYPPVDLGPFRFYGQAGIGFTLTDVSGISNVDTIDINLLYFVGLGMEIRLGPNLVLDANARYILAHPPPGTHDLETDWTQVTVGLLFKLPM